MRSLLVPVAATAIFATMGFAQAAMMEGNGVIKSMNASKHTVTMKNGKTYSLDKSVDMKGVKAGSKVTFNYDSKSKPAKITGWHKAM